MTLLNYFSCPVMVQHSRLLSSKFINFVERFKQCQEKSTQKPWTLKCKKLDMDKADEK